MTQPYQNFDEKHHELEEQLNTLIAETMRTARKIAAARDDVDALVLTAQKQWEQMQELRAQIQQIRSPRLENLPVPQVAKGENKPS